MSENKVLTNLNRNSPKLQFHSHLAGKIIKGSPLSTSKIKKSVIANYIGNNENEATLKSKTRLFSDSNSPKHIKKCGLCGNTTKKLKLTECCGNFICDDVTDYKLFDFFSSCNRNHDRYSLCAQHFVNDHKGIWQDCDECKKSPLNIVKKFNFLNQKTSQAFTCVNCSFSTHSRKAFLPKTKVGFLCQKKACREVKKQADL